MSLEVLKLQSPWLFSKNKQDIPISRPIIEREAYPHLLKSLNEDEATVLIGHRQVGKTSLLMRLIYDNFENYTSLYFNFDNPRIQLVIDSISEFLAFIKPYYHDPKQTILVFDEIQKTKDPGSLLKELYDLKLGFKIFASGSSSLKIREKVKETMAGRKFFYEIFPLSFHEIYRFIQKDFNGDFDYILRFDSLNLMKTFHEYLIYGGFPQVVLSEERERKIKILYELYTSYIEKDIVNLVGIEKTSAFNKLIKLLALNVGQLLNISSLQKESSLKRHEVENYLELLRYTFVIELLQPFSRSMKKEITRAHKVYFIDNGMKNLILNDFRACEDRAEGSGLLAENVIFNELKKNFCLKNLHFWRTKNGTEVDFILERENILYAIESKFKKEGLDFRNIDGFFDTYHMGKNLKAYIVSHKEQSIITRREYSITNIPFYNVKGII